MPAAAATPFSSAAPLRSAEKSPGGSVTCVDNCHASVLTLQKKYHLCLFSWGGGGTGELMEVLAVSADFSEYGVPKGGGGGVCYTFSESPEKGFFKAS